jgi:endonuclease VIII
MPEGPSLVILKEEVQPFKGHRILAATGNTKINKEVLEGEVVRDFKTWGKHFLICFKTFSLRVHFLLFGRYSINEQTRAKPRLHLQFDNGDLYLYTASLTIIEEDLDKIYDWTADVMSDNWNAAAARKKLKATPASLACDALLDQHIFAGSGNIIKNEVLFRTRVHPESLIGNIPSRKLTEIINDVRTYSFLFLEWKKAFELKKHWQAHTRKICPRCNIPFHKSYPGKTKRRAYYCENCQQKW